MNKPVILLMFLIGCLCLGLSAIYMIKTLTGPDGFGMAGSSSSAAGDPDHPGVAYADVPWKHLQSVPQFVLTDQTGSEFDSASIAGKPYAISFFFATCPSICRDLNKRIEVLNKELKNEDIMFVSITVDAETDTPEVLDRYAADFDATPDRWVMLTGQKYEIDELGKQVFRVDLSKETHTEDIILVDKWGRWRDRFKWDDPYDMKRLVEVVEELAAETEPPMDAIVHTRNVLAGIEPYNVGDVPFIREFHLEQSNGDPFFSRDLTGEVWIANFFFTSCPGICRQQNEYLSALAGRLEDHPAKIVSITTKPTEDTPTVLEEFSRNLGADPGRWIFCTGEDLTIRRTISEFFGAHTTDDHHTSLLFVVDRWGNVRGSFDWQKPEREVAMLKLIDELNAESVPPSTFEINRDQ